MLDASALLDVVDDRVPAETLGTDPAMVPAHFDAEVLHGLRGLVRGGHLPAAGAEHWIGILRASTYVRVALDELLDDAWRCSEAVSGYDALYVALARREDTPLVTTDARLARGATDLCEVRLL